MNSTELEHLHKLLDRPKKIVIVPHRNPDGDALGASLGMYLFLKADGHNVNVLSPNDYPEFLKWMPGENAVVKFDQEKEKGKKLIAEAEFIFTLDFNNFARTDELEKFLKKATVKFVMIDHHEQPGDYAEFMESDPEMSSTCEMVYHFFEKWDRVSAITPEIATCLYTGIMTDTGSFQYPSTTGSTHRCIATLIERGAKNAEIHHQVYDTNSYNRMQLLGVALKNLNLEKEFNTVYITLSQEELNKYHFRKGDTEGFVNYGLSVKGTIFAAIFIENKSEGIVKISLRSKGNFDVNKFARKYFNGGGHRNAAGGKSDKSLQKTISEFVGLLPAYKDELR